MNILTRIPFPLQQRRICFPLLVPDPLLHSVCSIPAP